LDEAVENVELKEGLFKYEVSKEERTNLWVDNRKKEIEAKIDNTKVAEEVVNQNLKFHVMGGCFSNKRNAEKLVKKLVRKGYDARLLGEFKNLHAVSYGSFVVDADARQLLAKVKEEELKAAWLLAKEF
jgi:cell division septation protein DedD